MGQKQALVRLPFIYGGDFFVWIHELFSKPPRTPMGGCVPGSPSAILSFLRAGGWRDPIEHDLGDCLVFLSKNLAIIP
jgi:hypothetical protein